MGEASATADHGGAQARAPLMSLDRVSRRFGALTALDEVTLDILPDEILGIAGPNGAGKSTLLNVCTGALAPSSGRVLVGGRDVGGQRPYGFCRLGVARTFQIPQVFSSMSVGDNVATGARFGLADKGEGGDVAASTDEALELTGLAPLSGRPASKADLLTRKRIMLAAAIATRPRLLFMDEPLGGLNAEEVASFAALIRRLHEQLRVTFVVVEHKIRALSSLSSRILILHFGAVLALDTPERVLANERVIEIYLGKRNLA